MNGLAHALFGEGVVIGLVCGRIDGIERVGLNGEWNCGRQGLRVRRILYIRPLLERLTGARSTIGTVPAGIPYLSLLAMHNSGI